MVGTRWAIYRVENRIATGVIQPSGYFGTPPKPEAVPSAAVFPWRVKRVIGGKPRPEGRRQAGTTSSHTSTGLRSRPKTWTGSSRSSPCRRRRSIPQTGQPSPLERNLTFRRDDEKPFTTALRSGTYHARECVRRDGARPRTSGTACSTGRHKIGYIRLGAIESGLDRKVAEMMADLTKQGCRALILDLRWCPGGYVDPGVQIAGMFLPAGSVISKMVFTQPECRQKRRPPGPSRGRPV